MSRYLRLIFFFIGLALLAVLLYRLDLKAVVAQLRGFGIYFLFIILISIFKNCFRTFAWKFALGDNSPNFWLLFWARLAGETAGYLSSGSIFVGEPLKVMLVRDRLHWKEGVASVVLERAVYSFTAVL